MTRNTSISNWCSVLSSTKTHRPNAVSGPWQQKPLCCYPFQPLWATIDSYSCHVKSRNDWTICFSLAGSNLSSRLWKSTCEIIRVAGGFSNSPANRYEYVLWVCVGMSPGMKWHGEFYIRFVQSSCRSVSEAHLLGLVHDTLLTKGDEGFPERIVRTQNHPKSISASKI